MLNAMTTLGSLLKPAQPLDLAAHPLDLPGLAAQVAHLTASATATPGPLGSGPAILASLSAWTQQDDDAHEPCSLTACRHPLHPGPCKGWKGTLHSVSPGTYKQIEEARVEKANARRVKRIADLRAQGKPIPRRLLTEIKPKPAPVHPAHNAQAVPLGQVNQKADLAGGQAHAAGQAVSKAAGVQVKTAPPLPLGPKQKKPTVAGRGPAFVITQPKVTDTYKLDKAQKITPQEWDDLSDADKATIRNELTAIKARGFGPQQARASALLSQLAAPTPGSKSSTANPGAVNQPSVTPGKVALGQATKTVTPAPSVPNAGPTPQPPGPPNNTPKAFPPHVQHARAVAGRAVGRPTGKAHVDAYGKLSKADFDMLDAPTQRTIRDDLANAKGKFLDPAKKQAAADLLDRFGAKHASPAPAGSPAAPGTTAMTPTNIAKQIRKDGSIDLVIGGKTITTGFDGSGHEGTLAFVSALGTGGGHYVVKTKGGDKHTLGKGELVIVATKAPAVPAHPKGYSDPQVQAVAAARSGLVDTDNILKTVGALSPETVSKLDDDDRKAILFRLAFIATHPKATQEQKGRATAYGRIINKGSPAQTARTWDHTPSLGELHADEQKSGHAEKTAALDAAAGASAFSTDRDSRAKALAGLTKAQFDSLDPADQRKITDALQLLHLDKSGYDYKLHKPSGDAITAYTGLHPGIHRLQQAEADYRAKKITGEELGSEFLTARVQAPGTTDKPGKAAVEAEAARIAKDNPSLPTYARVKLAGDPKYGLTTYEAAGLAGMSHNWDDAPRFSTSDFRNLFRPTEADLAAADPIHAQAIRDLQQHVLTTGLKSNSPWTMGTRNAAVEALINTDRYGHVNPERLAQFRGMSATAQQLVRSTLRTQLSGQTNSHAKTETWLALRQLEGQPPLSSTVLDAVEVAAERFPTSSDLEDLRRLDPADFNTLPGYVQDALRDHLANAQQRAEQHGPVRTFTPQDNPLKVMPSALMAHLAGSRPIYTDRRQRNASDLANFGTRIVNPFDRTRAYSEVPASDFKSMNAVDRVAIGSDLTLIAHNTSLPLPVRYGALFTKDVRLNTTGTVPLNLEQLVAVGAVDPTPTNTLSDSSVVGALNNLPKADFDSLDSVYKDAIDERIRTIQGPQQQLLTAKFHPQVAASPAANPGGFTPTAPASVQPHVQEALDTIYGVHPKSHTMAHQLSTYGALRGSDFGALNGQEQGHLLGDLSFIATTAKGPSADKARKLIDRFSPPGTPAGQVPTGAAIPPVNAVAGQVRYATPLKGLAKAQDSGTSGDGWISLPGGQRVWGAHGAAGLLLQHVDENTGEKRYLMVQRGPAISDPGKWTFPGGASDSKETPHQGATRETIEELGLKDDVFKDALVHGDHTFTVPGSTWKYTTVAAQVPKMIKPDLSTAHARAETSDAKWMTLDEIRALDKSGKLHGPIAGGKLEANVISLYPTGQKLGQAARPGPVSKRLKRLAMPSGGRQSPANFNAWPHPHKQSKGKDLIPDKTTFDAQRQKIKQDRVMYDGKTADGRLAAIGAQQGFDDTPTVLDKKEIDRLLATGDYIEAWRGVSGSGGYNWRSSKSNGKTAADINEEMRSGPAYYGKGIFGNGYYLATQRRVATQYADSTPGSIARILIPKSAITKKYDEVSKESHKNPRASKAKGNSYEDSTFYDPGRYAAAKGIDGIVVEHHHQSPGGGARHVAAPKQPAFNWLNRSVLIIQKEPG